MVSETGIQGWHERDPDQHQVWTGRRTHPATEINSPHASTYRAAGGGKELVGAILDRVGDHRVVPLKGHHRVVLPEYRGSIRMRENEFGRGVGWVVIAGNL